MSLFAFAPEGHEDAVGEKFPKKPGNASDDENEEEERVIADSARMSEKIP